MSVKLVLTAAQLELTDISSLPGTQQQTCICGPNFHEQSQEQSKHVTETAVSGALCHNKLIASQFFMHFNVWRLKVQRWDTDREMLEQKVLHGTCCYHVWRQCR